MPKPKRDRTFLVGERCASERGRGLFATLSLVGPQPVLSDARQMRNIVRAVSDDLRKYTESTSNGEKKPPKKGFSGALFIFRVPTRVLRDPEHLPQVREVPFVLAHALFGGVGNLRDGLSVRLHHLDDDVERRGTAVVHKVRADPEPQAHASMEA